MREGTTGLASACVHPLHTSPASWHPLPASPAGGATPLSQFLAPCPPTPAPSLCLSLPCLMVPSLVGSQAPTQTGHSSLPGSSHASAPGPRAFQMWPPDTPLVPVPTGPPRGAVPLGQPLDVHSDPLGELGHGLDAPNCSEPPPCQVGERREPPGPEPTDFLCWRLVVGSPPLAAAWHRKVLADRRRGGRQ